MVSQVYLVRMVVDVNSLGVMQYVADKTAVKVKVLAKAGQRYSSRGGENTSIVPKGYCHILVDQGTDRIKNYWNKVSHEKTKRRLILEANAVVAS